MSPDLNPIDKKKLYSLFGSLSVDINDGLNKTQTSDIILIDALNLFIRAWSVSPFMNENGSHTGGISGFLKSLGYAIKLFSPTRCIIVFDGSGGSLARRKIYPGYKNKRQTKVRLNRTYGDLSTSDKEEESMNNQLRRIVDYLDCLPVTTMAIDNVEADDVIAYLSVDKFKDSNITIMSADKDYLQLVNNRVKVWSPTKKKLYGCAEIAEEYGISCENFINYRALDGDISDNIEGVKGAGLKTIKKLFPIFDDHHRYSLTEIYNYCDSHKGKYKLYDTILESKEIMERNYQLMQLNESIIQPASQLRINNIVDSPIKKLNRFEFSKLVSADQIWNNLPNYQIWLGEVFGRLDSYVISPV